MVTACEHCGPLLTDEAHWLDCPTRKWRALHYQTEAQRQWSERAAALLREAGG